MTSGSQVWMRRILGGVLGVLTLTLIATVFVGLVVPAHRSGALNSLWCGRECPAELIAPPAGIEDVRPLDSTVFTAGTGTIDSAQLEAALAGPLADPALGTYGFVALDGRTGEPLVTGDAGALIPASTTKLLTAFTALSTLGPDQRFTTRVVRRDNTVILVGGGDPYLSAEPSDEFYAPASLAELADATAASLGSDSVTIAFDQSLFSGPALNPTWPASYVSGNVVSPISALWVDPPGSGYPRVSDPAQDAARQFRQMLIDRGVAVTGDVTEQTALVADRELASATSATSAQIVSEMLRTSDNETTEVMGRQAAIATGREASFAGATATVEATLAAAHIDTTGLVLLDTCGLSRDNRISALTLADVIWQSSQSPDTEIVAEGLPVAGYDGSLRTRLSAFREAFGYVRAKTGTLAGVHSLAGIATLNGGRPVIYAVIANSPDDAGAVNAIDTVSAAIQSCACSG